MSPQFDKRVLARISPDRMALRAEAIERLYLRAVSGVDPYYVRVAAEPSSGTSEVLRHIYDRLFYEQRFTVPFYFALRSSDRDARSTAARFAYEFILQTVAFRRREPGLVNTAPDICELTKLAPLADQEWINTLCETCAIDGPLNDDASFIRSSLAAPFRASLGSRFKTCVIIDDLQHAIGMEGGQMFLEQATSLAGRGGSTLILSSYREHRMPGYPGEIVRLDRPELHEAAEIAGSIGSDMGVAISDTVKDLLAIVTGRDMFSVRSLIAAARDRKKPLESYRDLAMVYAQDLSSGRVAERFDMLLSDSVADAAKRRRLIESLHLSAREETGFEIGTLSASLGLTATEADRLVRTLIVNEVIGISGSTARFTGSSAFRDYLELRYRTDAQHLSVEGASGTTVLQFLKRAPKAMSQQYRKKFASDLAGTLLAFDLQNIPRAAMDYRIYRDKFRGLERPAIKERLMADEETIRLPQLSHAASIKEFVPHFSEPEYESAVLAVGFTGRAYTDEDEIAWLAAEIDSKLEADPEVTLEWCRRLAVAAEEAGYREYRIWLIAPEGFSAGALQVLAENRGIGSSRAQAELLRELLDIEAAESGESKDYEMVIPAGEDTEIVAAHALEEIAKKYHYPARSLNQAKTALVEACINAAEHGLSPDKKIHQTFSFYPDKLTITVANRGIRLNDNLARVPAPDEPHGGETRRGWGLNLIKSLMDEVLIESVDDGTRIVMTKNMSVLP